MIPMRSESLWWSRRYIRTLAWPWCSSIELASFHVTYYLKPPRGRIRCYRPRWAWANSVHLIPTCGFDLLFTCLDKGIINNEMSVSMKKLMPLYVEFLCSSGDTEVLNTQSSLDSPVKLLCSTKIQDYMAWHNLVHTWRLHSIDALQILIWT